MKKIRNTPEGLKYASCYIGAYNIFEAYGGARGYKDFMGIHKGKFICHYSKEYDEYEEITLDTEANQPCIYACMREGLRVEVTWNGWKHICGVTFDFSSIEAQIEFLEMLNRNGSIDNIYSIKILGDFEGVEVEE